MQNTQKSTHQPFWWTCEVHHPWMLFTGLQFGWEGYHKFWPRDQLSNEQSHLHILGVCSCMVWHTVSNTRKISLTTAHCSSFSALSRQEKSQSLNSGSRGGSEGPMEPPFKDKLMPKNSLDLAQPDPTCKAVKQSINQIFLVSYMYICSQPRLGLRGYKKEHVFEIVSTTYVLWLVNR